MSVMPVLVAGALVGAAPASASLDTLLAAGSCSVGDAKDSTAPAGVLPYKFCDDMVPSASGGIAPNPTAERAVEVPSAYAGIRGLPAADPGVVVPGESPSNTVALDVDVTLPDPARFSPANNEYPLVVMMHGCCSGDKRDWEGASIDPGGNENWHYNNAWFASRGYVVLTYTARGFVNGQNRGSTGETQLDSAKFEINDFQHLAGQLVDKGDVDPDPAPSAVVKVDPDRIVPTGGSYGGGLTWLALTDPTWLSPGTGTPASRTPMKVVAAASKYGWTNLVESLVPRGDDLRDALPETDPAKVKASLRTLLGFPKQSINAALFASGTAVGVNHTTFTPGITEAQTCLNSTDPFETNPACTRTINEELPRFIDERSAYFQQPFFDGLANGSIAPVPVFSAGTFTDQLFPAPEHRRMVERLKQSVAGEYPVQEFYGDYNHFVQNKRKEWSDLCGDDRHVCTFADYGGASLTSDPASLARENGVTTRLNRFIDHYAEPPVNTTRQPRPAFDVTGSLQVCPQNATFLGAKLDEPGPRFTASRFDQLAPNTLSFGVTGAQSTTSMVPPPNSHARNADPVTNSTGNGGRCPVESSPGGVASAGPGVATYDSDALGSDYTMLGQTRAFVANTGTGSGLQLNARLYDLYPDGTQVLVDRGVKRIAQANGFTVFDMHGAGWKFARGHRVRVEFAQDDSTYIKASTQQSSMVIQAAGLSIPVREASAQIGGIVPPSANPSSPPPGGNPPSIAVSSPRLASDSSTSRRFAINIRTRPGTSRANIANYRLQIRDVTAAGAAAAPRRVKVSQTKPTRFMFKGRAGRTYVIRAQAIDKQGRAGAFDTSRTIVPFDDSRKATKGIRTRGRFARPRVRGSYGGRLTRSTRRGAQLGFRFRGDRLFVVGRVSRRGGKAVVVVNRQRRIISFFAKRTRNRKVVAVFRTKRKGLNNARIVTLGRKGSRRGGKLVEIDALGVRTR